MQSGFKAGEVLADTDVRASIPTRLCNDSTGKKFDRTESNCMRRMVLTA
jgi:hypothetical protein